MKVFLYKQVEINTNPGDNSVVHYLKLRLGDCKQQQHSDNKRFCRSLEWKKVDESCCWLLLEPNELHFNMWRKFGSVC